MQIRELFLRHLAQTTPFPLQIEIERAQGSYMYGPEGKSYLDLISGIGVSSIGHRHPKVIAAIHAQLEKHLHVMVYGEMVQGAQVQLAQALAATLPLGLESVYLVNSGSEAAEGAMKLAKRFTGRSEIITCTDAYHGSTQGALSAGGNEGLKQAYRPLIPGFRHIGFGNTDDLQYINNQTAAVLIETVQGEAGVRVADDAYFTALRRKCDETGALLILDEIQCGMGRTGKFWAFEHYNIMPDILLTAKALGGGMPIGAFIAKPGVMQAFTENPMLGHISTFGGHPVSAAAALATLHAIQEENLLKGVEAKAALFKTLLQHPEIKEIRNCGLMMAAEFESFARLQAVILRSLDKGLLTDWFLFCDNSMRIAPPLNISESEIEFACRVILEAVEETR
ncbi:MAG: aminotransferase class III-fold pyridoxal phosphate-dependent enzyme [Bacteroidota bacterium]